MGEGLPSPQSSSPTLKSLEPNYVAIILLCRHVQAVPLLNIIHAGLQHQAG